MKLLYCILLLILFSSCHRNSDLIYEAPVFPDTLGLEAHVLNDKFIMHVVSNMYVYKDYLILYTIVDDYNFHIFNKYTGEYIKGFGAVGRGPGECRHPGPVVLNHRTGDFLAMRMNENRGLIYNIDSILVNNDICYKEISFQDFSFGISAIYWDSSRIKTAGGGDIQDTNHRLSIWDKDQKLLSNYAEYPPDVRAPFEPDLFDTFAFQCFSPDGTKFIAALALGDVMEIFDTEDSIRLRTTKRFHPIELELDGNMTRPKFNAVRGFADLSVTDSHIFGIYQGDRHYYWSKNIAKFDWDGNPLELYHTEYNLIRIGIDEPLQRIYAITRNKNSEIIIVYFNLPDHV